MRRLLVSVLRTVVSAVLWTALAGVALPALDRALYAARLAALPAPASARPPLPDLGRAALRDTWHASRPGGRRHEGLDLFAARGTPVLATTEGIVLRRNRGGLGGNAVWLLGPGGQRHYYAHLDGFAALAIGERVQPGTVLGFVGNTGNARTTPPHLHYGIYTRRGAINPYPLIAASALAHRDSRAAPVPVRPGG